MNFALNESHLKPDGEAFIQSRVPQLARILCSAPFQPHIDALIVEGHTDQSRPANLSASQGEQWNLQLSQDRSMEVVKQSLTALEPSPAMRAFFLAKLSASGRGESEPVRAGATAEENRRVVFKIRVKSDQVQAGISRAMGEQAMATQQRPNW
jgi:outer membrane protein OmpA-like peptidoglycan-associated protein